MLDPPRLQGPRATDESGGAAARHGPSPRHETLLDLLTGAVVLIAYVIVQRALLQGPHPHDPAIYFQAARLFPDVDPHFFTLRLGVITPVRAALVVFGPSEAALYAVPLATGIVLVAAVYGTMLLLLRDRVLAAAAGLVTGLNSYHLLNSSFVFPDTVATATFTAGFLCLLLGGMRMPRERGRGWLPALLVIAAGALFGWTYLAREFSPVLLPAVVAAAVLLRYGVRQVAMLVAGAVATFSLEPLYSLVRYGDPLVRIELLFRRGDMAVEPRRLARMEHIQGQLDNVFDTISVFPQLVLSWAVGWVFVLLIVVFVVALARLRDRRLWLLAAWGFGFWATMAVLGLVTLPSGSWVLNITNPRYWYPIFPPLVMGAFLGIGLLFRRSLPSPRTTAAGHVVAAGLVGLALIPGVVEFERCAAKDVWRHDPAAGWDDLRSWFATTEAQRYSVVWTDNSSRRLIPAFTSTTFGQRLWEGDVRPFPRGGVADVRAVGSQPSVLVVNKDRHRRELNELRRRWSPIFVSGNGRMVVLAPASQVTAGAVVAAGAWWEPLNDGISPAELGTCGLSPYEPAG